MKPLYPIVYIKSRTKDFYCHQTFDMVPKQHPSSSSITFLQNQPSQAQTITKNMSMNIPENAGTQMSSKYPETSSL